MVHAGQRRIPPEIAEQLAEHAADDALTTRELDVLRGIAKGQSNKVIAFNLNIVEHTVKNHIKSILSKLDATDHRSNSRGNYCRAARLHRPLKTCWAIFGGSARRRGQGSGLFFVSEPHAQA